MRFEDLLPSGHMTNMDFERFEVTQKNSTENQKIKTMGLETTKTTGSAPERTDDTSDKNQDLTLDDLISIESNQVLKTQRLVSRNSQYDGHLTYIRSCNSL